MVQQRQQSVKQPCKHSPLRSDTLSPLRLQGDTTDPDRKITALKVDLGDGTITDFMPVTTPAQNVIT